MSIRKDIYIKIICIAKYLYKYSKLPLGAVFPPLRPTGINHLVLCSIDGFRENKPHLNASEKAEREMIMASAILKYLEMEERPYSEHKACNHNIFCIKCTSQNHFFIKQ